MHKDHLHPAFRVKTANLVLFWTLFTLHNGSSITVHVSKL